MGLQDYRPTMPEMHRHSVDLHRDLVQIVDQDGATSFGEVEAQSASIARGLIASGVGKGQRVGILLPNSSAWLAAWFGITRIGAVAVLVSTFSKGRELAHIIRHSDMTALLMADSYLSHDYVAAVAEGLPGIADANGQAPLALLEAPYLRQVWVFGSVVPRWAKGNRSHLEALGEEAALPHGLLQAAEAEIYPSDALAVLYTSGSSADPKAVVHSHGGVVRHCQTMSTYLAYQRGDHLLATYPPFWVAGLYGSLLVGCLKGATVFIPPSQRADDLIAAIDDWDITHIAAGMPVMNSLFDVDRFREVQLPRLKPVSSMYLGFFGQASPELTPNALGMTETFGPHSMERLCPLPEDRAGSFGRAVASIERKIVDKKTGEVLPPNNLGELCVRGYSLMLGYHKVERGDTFDRDGWFHTGDMCTLTEDGHLHFHGRDTEMIKSGGANVAPREVEMVLMSHGDVREAIVVGLDDAKRGQAVAAAIVLREGANLNEEDLRDWLKDRLSSYKIPRRIVEFNFDEIPRTSAGKSKSQELKIILQEKS